VGDLTDPYGMAMALQGFLEWMRMRNYSEQTVIHRERYLRDFIAWLEIRGVLRPSEVNRPILERYQRHLYHYRKQNGQPLSFRTQLHYLIPVRQLFKWLARTNRILANPASELDLPRKEHRLPKHVLTAKEVEQVLSQIDLTDPLGIRDRAIIETLYATGIRRLELMNLKLYDLDIDRGTLMIRQGKGKKDRMVPVSPRALAWIEKYLNEVRSSLIAGADLGLLFLTNVGEGFGADRLSQMVRRYIDQAKIGKTGSCHLFRHTVATLMLENGADIRYIQEMLGHAQLSTTEIYTRVSIWKLREIYLATHPAARNEPGPSLILAGDPPLSESAAFLSTLAAESDEE
jgi:integrase/recombinase XerD